MRRLCVMFVAVAALAGCSSGSTNVAGPTPTSSALGASSAPGSASPGSSGSSESAGGDTTKFCAAFATVKAARSNANPAAAGAAFQSAAADMRAYVPVSIRTATGTYADLIDNIGKAAQAGSLDVMTLQQALTKGMAEKPEDIAVVAIWVSKHCPR